MTLSAAGFTPDLDLERRGAAMFGLVQAFEEWVDRRVTTITLHDAEFARVSESVDFTLAPQIRRRLTVDGVGVLVPFGWLRREPLRGFDLKVGSTPVAMLSGLQSVPLTLGLVEEALRGHDLPETDRRALGGLARVLTSLEHDDDRRRDELTAFRTRHGLAAEPGAGARSPLALAWVQVAWLFEALATSFLAVAVLPDGPAQRTIVKYSYDLVLDRGLARPRLRVSRTTSFELASALLGASHHVDLVLPTELQASYARLEDLPETAGPGVPVAGRKPLRDVDRIAFHVRREDIARTVARYGVRTRLALETPPMTLPAVIISFSLLLLVLAGWLRNPTEVASTATAILFAFSGTLSALVQRQPESSLVARLTRGPRVGLTASGLAVLAAGASRGLRLPPDWTYGIWTGSLVVLVLSTALLLTALAGGVRRSDAGRVPVGISLAITGAVGTLLAIAAIAVALPPWSRGWLHEIPGPDAVVVTTGAACTVVLLLSSFLGLRSRNGVT